MPWFGKHGQILMISCNGIFHLIIGIARRVDNDLKSGGRFIFRMEAKDGSEGFDHSGIYDTVIHHQLIAYTGDDGRKSKIKFISFGDTTMVSETFEPEISNPIDMQRDFCQVVLHKFKDFTESKKV